MTRLLVELLPLAVAACFAVAQAGKAGQCNAPSTGTPIGACQPSSIPSVCRHTPAYDRVYLNGTIRLQAGVGQCGAPTKALLDYINKIIFIAFLKITIFICKIKKNGF
ncbi:hypothetical protein BV898_04066 [Hypsibius exemplaris]|uniref:Uncharacterized protein n=1 Tax=Hypsibius exemplaris TaxID=2072580 RepID=A0A1W0X3J1_HYPEX|nr:hypothetical protein BV898_04066 [Hypsibius exemplaris]